MNDKECHEYLRQTRPDLHFDVLVRCWDVPCLNGHIAHCCGSHYELLRILSTRLTVHSHIETCRRKVDALFSQQKDVVRVACCDSHGIHRSYAVATILQGICEAKGYTSTGPYHMDKLQWTDTVCTKCKSCRPSDHKEVLYETMAEHW